MNAGAQPLSGNARIDVDADAGLELLFIHRSEDPADPWSRLPTHVR